MNRLKNLIFSWLYDWAAGQDKPEIECPNCGATIRARMSLADHVSCGQDVAKAYQTGLADGKRNTERRYSPSAHDLDGYSGDSGW